MRNKLLGNADDFSFGLDNLHDYLDITKLIKRLQDMDKLKAIFLSEDQKLLFDCIPKPSILKTKSNKNILSPKRGRNSKIDKVIASKSMKICNDDTLTKKILEMLDPKTRNEITQSFFFLFYQSFIKIFFEFY